MDLDREASPLTSKRKRSISPQSNPKRSTFDKEDIDEKYRKRAKEDESEYRERKNDRNNSEYYNKNERFENERDRKVEYRERRDVRDKYDERRDERRDDRKDKNWRDKNEKPNNDRERDQRRRSDDRHIERRDEKERISNSNPNRRVAENRNKPDLRVEKLEKKGDGKAIVVVKGEKKEESKNDLFLMTKTKDFGPVKDYEKTEWNLVRAHDREHIKSTKLTKGLPQELEDELIGVLEVEYRQAKAYTDSRFNRFQAELSNDNNNNPKNNNIIGIVSKFTTTAFPDQQQEKKEDLIFGDVYKYTCLHTLGGGAYSNVYLAEDAKKNQYALKKLKVIDSHKPERTQKLIEREIEALRACKGHINIVELIEIVINKEKQIFLVLEYCEHNLKRLIGEKPLTSLETKKLIFQLLNGLDFAHSKNIIHRDLKPDNLLVSRKGVLKIADFGSARVWERGVNLTPGTTTLRYRAPEILLGAEKYDKSVDVWSAGCIFAEMLLGKALFEGKSELEQTQKMSDLLGSFKERWGPGFSKLPRSKDINQPSQPTNYLKTHLSVCTELSDKGFDLINNMLRYDPMRRLTTTKALAHDYFQENPKVDINSIPK